MNAKKIYLMDKSLEVENIPNKEKYIAKSYKKNGGILYFDEDDPDDGFGAIINDLQNAEQVQLFTSKDKIKATIEFLNELKFSVENSVLTLVFKNDKNVWTETNYEF